jgi:phenylacetate-coenzyme A ligase PaaK-like adenylate-forming protein
MPAPILHASRDEIRAVQDAELRKIVELCAQGSPFYRKMFEEQGLSPADFENVDDLVKLPLTRKGDLMGDPEAFRLNIPDLPVQERVTWDMAYTTGTTGTPTPIYSTTHDFYAIIEIWTRILTIGGVREDDILANLFPLTAYPSGSFIRSALASAGTGALVLNAIPGQTYPPFPVQRSVDTVIKMVEKKKATVLLGVPSFVRRFLMRAEELGADFSSVRLTSFVGEPCPDGLREDIRTRLKNMGAKDPELLVRLGFTEAQAAFPECRERGPLHNPAPDLYYFEILDPDTLERVPEGQPGLLVMTHFNRRGTVLLRYVVGDITSMSFDPCPHCGRTGGLVLQQPFRADHLTKIKGMLVNPDVIRDLLSARAAIAEYQIVFRKEDDSDPYSMDELLIRLATDEADKEGMKKSVIGEVREAVRVTPKVEFVDQTAIYVPGSSMKAARVVDERKRAV